MMTLGGSDTGVTPLVTRKHHEEGTRFRRNHSDRAEGTSASSEPGGSL